MNAQPDAAKKGALPLVFLHGLGASAARVREDLEDLPGVDLLALDLPGHGGIPLDRAIPGPGFLSFAQYAETELRARRFPKRFVGGLSMGSGVALRMALESPEKTLGLILLRPAWLDQKQPENLEIVRSIGLWLEEGTPAQARDRVAASAAYRAMELSHPRAAHGLLSLLQAKSEHLDTRVLSAMPNDRPFAHFDELKEVRCPTLVLGSPADPLHPLEMAETIAKAIPGAEFEVLPPRYDSPFAHREELRRLVQNSMRTHSE